VVQEAHLLFQVQDGLWQTQALSHLEHALQVQQEQSEYSQLRQVQTQSHQQQQ
jgi:hypothetical protein